MEENRLDIEETPPVGGGAYVVKQGECIYSVAAQTGHDWKTLWDHPENALLKDTRKNPGVLLPGDRIHIPELKLKTINLETGKRHRIVITGQTVTLRLRMCDADGEPIAHAKYMQHVEGQAVPVTTDGDGNLKKRVPALATAARLDHIQTGEGYNLNLGHMDPAGTSSAIRKRLSNLGYNPDSRQGQSDSHAVDVLLAYCEDADLDRETPAREIMRRLEEKDPWRS